MQIAQMQYFHNALPPFFSDLPLKPDEKISQTFSLDAWQEKQLPDPPVDPEAVVV
jgi:hypothetical protein